MLKTSKQNDQIIYMGKRIRLASVFSKSSKQENNGASFSKTTRKKVKSKAFYILPSYPSTIKKKKTQKQCLNTRQFMNSVPLHLLKKFTRRQISYNKGTNILRIYSFVQLWFGRMLMFHYTYIHMQNKNGIFLKEMYRMCNKWKT